MIMSITLSQQAETAPLDVLWYGQSGPTSSSAQRDTTQYNGAIGDIPGDASANWNLEFWEETGPVPDFDSYDVLFIGTGEPFGDGFERDRLLSNSGAISAARGSRTLLSGLNPDNRYKHYYNFNPNGIFDDRLAATRDFMVDAVNWAGQGQGLNIVSMVDHTDGPSGWHNENWWLAPGSFLQEELDGFVQYEGLETGFNSGTYDGVQVTDMSHPANLNSTGGSLSGWGFSGHAAFKPGLQGYTPIQALGSDTSLAATVVSDRGAAVAVPTPNTLLSLVTGLVLILGMANVMSRRRLVRG
jgi:hypothetical protein